MRVSGGGGGGRFSLGEAYDGGCVDGRLSGRNVTVTALDVTGSVIAVCLCYFAHLFCFAIHDVFSSSF